MYLEARQVSSYKLDQKKGEDRMASIGLHPSQVGADLVLANTKDTGHIPGADGSRIIVIKPCRLFIDSGES